MKILLVYFSGTGNTRYYSELMAREISMRGHECELFNIEDGIDLPGLWRQNPVIHDYMLEAEKRVPLDPPGIEKTADEKSLRTALEKFREKAVCHDLIGFGSPVYFFRPAPVMESFIEFMPDIRGKSVFTYGTHMEGPVEFPQNFGRLLKNKTAGVAGHVDDHIMHSELIPGLPDFLPVAKIFDVYLKYRLPMIKRKISAFLNKLGISKNSSSIRRLVVPEPGAGMKAVGKLIEKALYSSFGFSIGNDLLKERCTRCGLCAKNCPMGLISFKKDRCPTRSRHCMYCLRCLNICPEKAVIWRPIYKNTARFKGFGK